MMRLDRNDVRPGAPIFGPGLLPGIVVLALCVLWRYSNHAWIGHIYPDDPYCLGDYAWTKCRTRTPEPPKNPVDGPRAFNPKTGQTIKWNGAYWEPEAKSH